tara:strand:+ start:324 stop:602 length:279 start_codon:yes stop_codon:yes gene_type:complete
MNYAQIVDGLVVNVIVADADFISTQTDKTYVLCQRGGIGWTFDGTNFIAPQPYPSWTLDSNFDWQPPTPKPSTGGRYRWSEEELKWLEVVLA